MSNTAGNEAATNELRWVVHPLKHVKLQQKWIVTNEAGEVADEWRDVPVVKEND